MKKFLLFFLLLVNVVFCEDLLRIQTLTPENLAIPLAIEPAIPENFIAMSPEGELKASEWTYWGPKEVLEAYFKDPSSLSEPIIRMSLDMASQTKIESQKCGEEILLLPSCGIFKDRYLKWGNYPVYTMTARFASLSKECLLMAWMGPNHASDMTIKFQLIYPSSIDGEPSPLDLAFWNNFLSNTQQLSPKSLMKAHGLDIEEGFTIVNQMNAKLKVVAEERKSDHRLQVAVIPIEGEPCFEFQELSDYTWEGKPAVVAWGAVTTEEGNSALTKDGPIIVIVQEVEEFSIDKEDDPHLVVYEASGDFSRHTGMKSNYP